MKLSRSDRPFTSPAVFRLMAAFSVIILISVATGKIAANAPPAKTDFKVTTVFLVRHAEKATTPPDNPPLTEAGNARSQRLADILQQAGIKAIYTSQFLRTKQTAEPLAKSLSITPVVLPIMVNPSNPREVSEESIKEITQKILGRAGDAALVVGHSNTLPQVIKMLGADEPVKIDETDFNNLFIVTVYAKGKAHVTRLKY